MDNKPKHSYIIKRTVQPKQHIHSRPSEIQVVKPTELELLRKENEFLRGEQVAAQEQIQALLQENKRLRQRQQQMPEMMMALEMQTRQQQYYEFMQEAMRPQAQFQTDNMSYEQLLAMQDQIGYVSRGLTKEQIKQIPKKKVLNRQTYPEPCTICQNELKLYEKLRLLPCKHYYHSKCIKQWLTNEKKLLEDDTSSIKKFLKFQKLHRGQVLRLPVSTGIESKAYKLTLHRINGFKRPSNPQMSLLFSVAANLFIQNQNDREFLGRTYDSPRFAVDFGADGVNYEHQPLSIYFHTKVTGSRETSLLIILELQAYESQQDLVLRRQLLGWVEMPALTITQTTAKLTLRKGSPRVLLLNQQVNYEQTGFIVMADLNISPEYQLCQHLIPENMLCGDGDEVPGLKQGHVGVNLELSKSTVVFLSHVQVLIPDQLEVEVYKQVQKYRQCKYRTPDDYKGDIQITNKKMVVAYHNGWTFINSRANNNFVPLGDSRKILNEVIDGKQIQFKILEYQGVIDINNVCTTEQSMNSGMLIAQLEYEATFLVNNTGRETLQLVIGWIPIYINNKIGTEEQIDQELIIGPGKTINGKNLVQFTTEIPVIMRANLNMSGGGFQVQEVARPQQHYEQARAVTIANDSAVRKDYSEADMRGQVRLKDMERQIMMMQEENDRLKRLAMQPKPEDFHKQQEYIKAIETLREDNKMMQFTQAKKFEGLERLIKDTQSTVPSHMGPIISEQNPQNVHIKQIDSYAYPVPQASMRPIGKEAFGTHLIDLIDDSDVIDRMMVIEDEDERRDNIIVIQPLSLKQQLGDYPVCRHIHFTLHFYDLPAFQTPILALEYCNDERNFKFNVENGNPLRLLQNGETYSVKFNVETSTQRYFNLVFGFAHYLYYKNLLIDIWDSDTMLLFGSIRMPLRGLLRQGKQSNHILSDIDILDPHLLKCKGQLQVLVRNIGKSGQTTNKEMDATYYCKTMPAFTKSIGMNKTKIISEKPINREYVPATEHGDGNRLQSRINKLKQSNLTNLTKTSNKESHMRSLNEVQKYKEVRKPTLIRQIVKGFLQNEKFLNVFYGQSETVPYYYKNTQSTGQQINIIVEDPDGRYLDYQEVMIIYKPAEWAYWVKQRHFPEPSSYDIIRTKEVQGKTQFYVTLAPSEEVTILIKFISFRQVDASMNEGMYSVDVAQQKGKEYIDKYIYPRYVSVYLQSIDGKVIDGIRLAIQPHQQPIDHLIRFYERDNRQTRLILPPLYKQAQEQKPILHITDNTIVVEWAADNNQVRLNLKVGEVCEVRNFSILAYLDPFQNQIAGHWKVEVHSLSGFDLEVPLGQQVNSKLTLPCDVTRIVSIASSNNRLITMPKPYDGESTLLPGKLNVIPFEVRSFKEGKQQVQINCVDVHSQELIYSWLININSIAQPPSAVYELRCMHGRESRQQVSYRNQTNYLAQFNINSSSDYVKIVDPLISAGPWETVSFKIRVMPNAEDQIKLFMNDTEDRIFDTILLKIKYSN